MNARPRHVVASCHLDRRDDGHAVANRSTGCRSWPAVSMFALSCFGRVLQLFVLNVVHDQSKILFNDFQVPDAQCHAFEYK